MRIASFNVENLFERARVMNRELWAGTDGSSNARWAAGRQPLEDYAALNALLNQPVYSAADKKKIIALLTRLGLAKSDESQLVILRRNRGALLKRPRSGGIEIVANGRDDWVGWVELTKEAVNEVATQNTARVLRDVNADIVVVVEAENRISLLRFNEQVLADAVGGTPYDHIMLVDGNDDRGIDVGLMTRATAVIETVRSHVDDRIGKDRIFSRDCPEFRLTLAAGHLVVLANHLKSKGYGVPAEANRRRLAQAKRVRESMTGSPRPASTRW